MTGRPSINELWRKIKNAKLLYEQGKFKFVNFPAAMRDFHELDLETFDEQMTLIGESLDNLKPEHYIGSTPPKRAYVACIKNRELFEFVYCSDRLNQKIYVKFAINSERLFLVSFHKERKGCS